jgi:hypothetical protein
LDRPCRRSCLHKRVLLQTRCSFLRANCKALKSYPVLNRYIFCVSVRLRNCTCENVRAYRMYLRCVRVCRWFCTWQECKVCLWHGLKPPPGKNSSVQVFTIFYMHASMWTCIILNAGSAPARNI